MAIPYREEWKDTRETVRKVLKKFQISPYFADEDITAGRDILCKICEKITNSDFGVIEVSTINPNVMFEFGLTLGRRKPVFIIFNKALSEKEHILPTDIVALERIEYRNQGTLEKKLTDGFQQFLSRLDIRQKRFDVMIELARGHAADGDFSTTTSLLETISLSLVKQGKLNGDFIELLEDVVKLSEKDIDSQVRFALALVKFSALNAKEELVDSYVDFVCQKLVLLSKKALQSGKEIVDSRLVKDAVARADKGKLFSRSGLSPLWMIEREDAFVLYAHLWRILTKVSDKKKLLEDLSKYVEPYLDERFATFLPVTRGILYDRTERPIKYAAWIQSVAEFEDDRKLRSYAKKASAELEKRLKDYYSSYQKQSKMFLLRVARRAGIRRIQRNP
jgi:nucleoside 2-deoxyribosyltransferase